MYRKVLVPLDGSRFAERVLAHIHWLILPKETELILIRIVEPYDYSTSPEVKDGLRNVSVTQLQQEAESYLKQVKGELREMGLSTHTHVLEADVASAICDVANAQNADLIAITTHGRSGIRRWSLGSITGRVIRTSSQPIFLVHATTEAPHEDTIHRILVPLDGSKLAEKALPKAQALAKEKDSEILLVQVIETVTGPETALHPETRDSFPAHRQTSAEHYLSSVQEQLAADGVSSDILVVIGRPAEGILDSAEARDVDMIVMSTHGRSGLSCWMYGCVAEKVLQSATCPLLLIRATPS